MPELPVPHSAPGPVHNARATLLHTALPAFVAPRLQLQPLLLYKPLATRVSFRDPAPTAERDRTAQEHPGVGFAIQWRDSREIVSPEIVSLVRNYRRDGLPIVHLYQSNQNLLAIGLNSHGVPGIYFTRHVAD